MAPELRGDGRLAYDEKVIIFHFQFQFQSHCDVLYDVPSALYIVGLILIHVFVRIVVLLIGCG